MSVIEFSGFTVGIPYVYIDAATKEPRQCTLDDVVKLLRNVLPEELYAQFDRYATSGEWRPCLEYPAPRPLVIGEFDECCWSIDRVDEVSTVLIHPLSEATWSFDDTVVKDFSFSLSERLWPLGYVVQPITDDDEVVRQLLRNRPDPVHWSYGLRDIPGVVG